MRHTGLTELIVVTKANLALMRFLILSLIALGAARVMDKASRLAGATVRFPQ